MSKTEKYKKSAKHTTGVLSDQLSQINDPVQIYCTRLNIPLRYTKAKDKMERRLSATHPVILSEDVLKTIRELPEEVRQIIARTFTNVVLLSQDVSEQSLTPIQSIIWAMISACLRCDSRRLMNRLSDIC